MAQKKSPSPKFPSSQPKPLVLAIRTLIAGSLALGGAEAIACPTCPPVPVPLNLHGLATTATVGNAMVIHQNQANVSLDWQSFDIGQNHFVRFVQPTASSIALNNIHDGSPSSIDGSLTANGQVYLVNQNGFVFGQHSQVNVNSLVATTLNISQDTFNNGITKVLNLNQQAALDGGYQIDDNTGKFKLDGNGNKIPLDSSITIEQGAQIRTNAANGRIIIAGQTVDNAGTVSAPDGQVILAAAKDKVYLQEADSSSNIRGLLVEVKTGGKLTNEPGGQVLAARGNASLIGYAVNQNGLVSATSSVSLNGSVRLIAREGVTLTTNNNITTFESTTNARPDRTVATVKLGGQSITAVEPDADKTATALDAQTQVPSSIEISGKKVLLEAGSTVSAPSGNVSITAPNSSAGGGNSRIYMDTGSVIDVSGLQNVSLPMARNVVQLQLLNNELRDSPLQKHGILHGKTVSVDLRTATEDSSGNWKIPIADITGAVSRIARNIDERSTAGGTINLNSDGDVIVQTNATLGFAGGSVAYQPGYIKTTWLVDATGAITEISKADPNHTYASIFGEWTKYFPKWGITDHWSTFTPLSLGVYQPGYVEGKSAGALNISAFNVLMDGIVKGGTIDGKYQRTPAQIAGGGSLSIDLHSNPSASANDQQAVIFQSQPAALSLALTDPLNDPFPRQNGNTGSVVPPKDPFPPRNDSTGKVAPLILDTGMLSASGVRKVSIVAKDQVSIPSQQTLELPQKGKLNIVADTIDVEGSIVAPSGTIALASAGKFVDSTGMFVDNAQNPASQGSQGGTSQGVLLGPNALIDARGAWVNDKVGDGAVNGGSPIAVDGGSVAINTVNGDLRMDSGSRIDVSGGAWLDSTGNITAGRGGDITLAASGNNGQNLFLQGQLNGWGLTNGGTLSLTSAAVEIGTDVGAAQNPSTASSVSTLVLDPGFFQLGGFANYKIGANFGGLTVQDNARIMPLMRNFQLDPATGYQSVPGLTDKARDGSANNISAFGSVVLQPEFVRRPVNLSLSVTQPFIQRPANVLEIGKGAQIQTDMGGQVSLASDTSIIVNGVIDAPAGKINLTVTAPGSSATQSFYPSQGIWLGSSSGLYALGGLDPVLNNSGLQLGSVLPGGGVTLTANRGYIVTAAGSVIDVSGSSALLDVPKPLSNGLGTGLSLAPVASGGGSIALTAAEGILADGTFSADAGGAGAAGGALAVELNKQNRTIIQGQGDSSFPDYGGKVVPRVIQLSTSSDDVIPGGLAQGGDIPLALNGLALLKVPAIQAGGFASVELKTNAYNTPGDVATPLVGQIVFEGNVNLDAQRQIVLDTPAISWVPAAGADAASVRLSAPYIALGSTQSRVAPQASVGKGSFVANANGLDLVGGLGFRGFGTVSLNSSGDIRMRGIIFDASQTNYAGALNVAGNLDLTAAQIYPSTLTDYTVTVGSTGNETLRIQGLNGDPAAPLSALGNLTLAAPNILQQGVLRAPFGTLRLNAAKRLELAYGSLTSVSGAGLSVPFGRVVGALDWMYPLDYKDPNDPNHRTRIFGSLPEKRIDLQGPTVSIDSGSRVDLSGGGDLKSFEWIPGPGGSTDVLNPLDPAFTTKYAVLPGLNNILTPYDPYEFPASGLSTGDSVYLGGGSGLAAGWYTLLPAHYALLPGAFLITPQSNSTDFAPNTSFRQEDGATVVAGRFGVAGTGIQDSRWSGFAVEPGSVARTRSEYQDYSANAFFAAKAAQQSIAAENLPSFAANMTISATNALSLGGAIRALGAGGGQVDINAEHLVVASRQEDVAASPQGTITLFEGDLGKFKVRSLLLGGFRSQGLVSLAKADAQGNLIVDDRGSPIPDANGVPVAYNPKGTGYEADHPDTSPSKPFTDQQGHAVVVSAGDATAERVTVGAQTLDVNSGVKLAFPELILASRDQLSVHSGASLESDGKSAAAVSPILVQGVDGNNNGALIRLSDSAQANILRGAVSGAAGTLNFEAGSQIKAAGSVLLDSTRDTRFGGLIDMNGGALALKSSQISLGNAPAGIAGLVLNNAQLAGFNVDELALNSNQDLNLYGDVNLKTKSLTIAAAGIEGFANDGGSSLLSADSILISNNAQAITAVAGTGTGSLDIGAAHLLQLGGGGYDIHGFGQVRLSGGDAISGLAKAVDPLSQKMVPVAAGTLTVGGDLTLSAGEFNGGAGATTAIDARGHRVAISSAVAGKGSASAGLGASWSISADRIDSAGRFDLPAGKLQMTAPQGIDLGAGTVVDVSGRAVPFQNLTTKYSPAGSIVLRSDNGNVSLAPGASLDLSGASGGQGSDAGLLNISAVNGSFDWGGQIQAQPSNGALAGRFQLDVSGLGTGGFSALNGKLAAAGFTEEVSIEQRLGDVAIGSADRVSAHDFNLTVDQGQVSIGGVIDASGAKAGTVSIYGRNGIALAGQIIARSRSAATGGTVTLDTVHRDDTGSGLLDLSSTAGRIDVGSDSAGNVGYVHLRTGRDDIAKTLAVSPVINTAITGAERAVLEATRIYTPPAGSQVNSSATSFWKSDAAGGLLVDSSAMSFWKTDAAGFFSGYGSSVAGRPDIALAPGVELRVRGIGDLTLGRAPIANSNGLPDQNLPDIPDKFDFFGWRNGTGVTATPGYFTVNVAGNLNLRASLSDAFATGSPFTTAPYSSTKFQDMLQLGDSWSYSLIAQGNVNLLPNIEVRTGTGDISVKAGGNVVFQPEQVPQVQNITDPIFNYSGDRAAVIYTIGKPVDPNAPVDPSAPSANKRFGALSNRFALLNYMEFPTHGGNVSIKAGGDVVREVNPNVRPIQQLITEWMVRAGNWGSANIPSTSWVPTMWGINIAGLPSDPKVSGAVMAGGLRSFKEGIGALGGGDVTVEAGGKVQDVSVMIPTTGKPVSVGDPASADSPVPLVQGGGDLTVRAGGDILGGVFYTGRGTARIDAGGSVGNGYAGLGPALGLGDTQFDVSARQNISLDTAFNPTVISQNNPLPNGTTSSLDTLYFTYQPTSSLALTAIAGDILLQNNSAILPAGKTVTETDPDYVLTYPGTVTVASLSGDLTVLGGQTISNATFHLFPSAQGQLELLAANNVTGNGIPAVVDMSDADPALSLNVKRPNGILGGHAVVPLHQNDPAPVLLVANQGDISFVGTNTLTLQLPKRAEIYANRDILGLSLIGQNLSAGDITRVQAGRDIRYDLVRNPLTGAVDKGNTDGLKMVLSGPGQLQLIAGRNIDLGTSFGIQTVGGQSNTALSGMPGADILLLPGFSGKLDSAGFNTQSADLYLIQLELLKALQGNVDAQAWQKLYPSWSRLVTAANAGTPNFNQPSLDQLLSILQKLQMNIDPSARASLYAYLSNSVNALGGMLANYRAYGHSLSTEQQLEPTLDVLYSEQKFLGAAASAFSVTDPTAQPVFYDLGRWATNTLFPSGTYQGDLKMFYSSVSTLAGGSVDIAAPGGLVNAGLAGGSSGGTNGILVQDVGNLNAYTQGDFVVNASRVFTMGGGDILIWSGQGSIDAGRAAKSSISVPPPIYSIDNSGKVVATLPPIVSGGGIQSLSAVPGVAAGKSILVTPQGHIDAGEAGISCGQCFIAGPLNNAANVISTQGPTLGGTTAVAPPVVPAGADSAAAGVAKSAAQMSSDGNGKSDANTKPQTGVSIVHADVVGYGNCSTGDVREGKAGCGG